MCLYSFIKFKGFLPLKYLGFLWEKILLLLLIKYQMKFREYKVQ